MAVKRRDIVFLCQYFYPETNSSATLPFDTAVHLSQKGYAVDALCGYPKEYCFSDNVGIRETVKGVSIKRIRYLQLKRNSKSGRLINYASFTIAALFRVFGLRKYRAVVVYSNPPILPLVALAAKALFKTRIIYVSYDVYPEIAYSSGSLNPGGIVSCSMDRVNASVCKEASAVVALTDEMKQYLLDNRRTLEEDRTFVIPNWAHEGIHEQKHIARELLGFKQDDFIVCYFGNLGVCQDIETIKTAIALLKNEPNIKFLFAGHGSKLKDLKQYADGYENVRIVDYLTGDDFEKAVSAGSCGIVSLEKGLKGMCAPSKYYTCIQGGLPVIPIVEDGSYLADEVEREGIGKHVRIGDGQSLALTLKQLSEDNDRLEEMSHRAKTLYFDKYCMRRGMEKYERLLSKVLDDQK